NKVAVSEGAAGSPPFWKTHPSSCAHTYRLSFKTTVCRSLTIHRVESALSTESVERLAQAKARNVSVPSATHDCVTTSTRKRLKNGITRILNESNFNSIPVLDDVSTARRQSYRVK